MLLAAGSNEEEGSKEKETSSGAAGQLQIEAGRGRGPQSHARTARTRKRSSGRRETGEPGPVGDGRLAGGDEVWRGAAKLRQRGWQRGLGEKLCSIGGDTDGTVRGRELVRTVRFDPEWQTACNIDESNG